MARVRAGDDRAFELVFDRYHRGLLAFCGHMLGSREEAEDALQHTFMAAYRSLRATRGEIRLRAWLYTIARNRCLSLLRARREQVVFDETRAATHGLAADVDRRADLRELLADLERVPDEQRAALVLFELGDHPHDEIAEILGVRREKVKALVFQARESLASWRRARETPCTEIREQLATLRGAALKRATLRRHVARCDSCREFGAEVRRQRKAMAAVLPIAPSAGLKGAVLSAVLGGGTAATGAGGGGAAIGLGAAKGLAAKTMLCAAVAGSAGSAGYVAVKDLDAHRPAVPKHAAVTHAPAHHAKVAHRATPPRPVGPAPSAQFAGTTAATKPAPVHPVRVRHRQRAAKPHPWAGRREHRSFERRSAAAPQRWRGRHKARDRHVQFARPDGRFGGERHDGGWRDRSSDGHGPDGHGDSGRGQRVPSGGDQPAGVPRRR